MAAILGKDCTVSVGGSAVSTVRSVVWSQSAKEIEVHPFGERLVRKWACGYEATVDIEFTEDPAVNSSLVNGTSLRISGSGYAGDWIITNIRRSEPLDDIVTVTITAKPAV